MPTLFLPANDKNTGDRAMRSIFLAVLLAGALFLAMALAFAQADIATGQKLFAQRCAACHSVTAAETKLQGPNLFGIVDRKAASAADFKYSSAFTETNQTWNEKNLDEFLAAPARFVPGTAMVLVVPQAVDREDLIAYLKTLK